MPVRFTSRTGCHASTGQVQEGCRRGRACARRGDLAGSPILTARVAGERDPRCRHDDVEAAEVADRGDDRGLVVGRRRGVEVDEDRLVPLAAQIDRCRLAGVVQHVGDDDAGALLRETLDAGQTDAVRPARDERDLAISVQPCHEAPEPLDEASDITM